MSTSTSIDIYDPDWYLHGDVHGVFAELRATDPVHWQEVPGEAGYWAVLRHRDVVTVARNPEVYSSWAGGVMVEDSPAERLEQSRRMMLIMDEPQHMHYRRPLAPHFGPNVISRMDSPATSAILTSRRAGRVDFVKTSPNPCRTGDGAADGPAERGHRRDGDGDVIGLAAERRPLPRTDDVSPCCSTRSRGRSPDGRRVARPVLRAAGHRRQRHDEDVDRQGSTSSCIIRTSSDGSATTSSLVPSAVEEMLRYGNPVHYMRHTATRDVVLGGQRITTGDKVAMVYTSANHDEEVSPIRSPRHRPHAQPAPQLRHRRPFLPRCARRPAGGSGLHRGAARRRRVDRAARRTHPDPIELHQRLQADARAPDAARAEAAPGGRLPMTPGAALTTSRPTQCGHHLGDAAVRVASALAPVIDSACARWRLSSASTTPPSPQRRHRARPPDRRGPRRPAAHRRRRGAPRPRRRRHGRLRRGSRR